MSTETISTEMQELVATVGRLMARVKDPEATKRACDRMDRMREETRQRVGTVDVAVDLVRDARDR